jgi:hypothetical protein
MRPPQVPVASILLGARLRGIAARLAGYPIALNPYRHPATEDFYVEWNKGWFITDAAGRPYESPSNE